LGVAVVDSKDGEHPSFTSNRIKVGDSEFVFRVAPFVTRKLILPNDRYWPSDIQYILKIEDHDLTGKRKPTIHSWATCCFRTIEDAKKRAEDFINEERELHGPT
jgi:hypothetical protein